MNHTPEAIPQKRRSPETVERIAQAALRFKGKLYTGAYHDEALVQFRREYPDWERWDDTEVDDIEYGFTTNTGRFVDRTEAKQIADRAEQLLRTAHTETRSGDDELDSFDVDLRPKPDYLH